ncbi:MAG: hypothetical protein M3Q65_20105, partial [Chloroflexota bacterium]|nr:hypothetical protein [Chloroflexota bacterium]
MQRVWQRFWQGFQHEPRHQLTDKLGIGAGWLCLLAGFIDLFANGEVWLTPLLLGSTFILSGAAELLPPHR